MFKFSLILFSILAFTGRALVFTYTEEMENYYILSSPFDTMLTDVKEKELKLLSNFMNFSLNAPTQAEPTFPITGIVYGKLHKLIVPLIIRHQKKSY